MTARRALTLAGAAALALAAGCSSSPGVAAQATAGRSVVLGAARQLPGQIAATGVAWTGAVVGGYELCGANDPLASPSGDTSVQYTAQMLLTAFSQATGYPTFRRQVVEALDGLGWGLKPVTGGSSAATYYAGRRAGVDLRLIELDQPQTFGPTATVFLSHACFAAGSAALQYLKNGPDYNATVPRPSATPRPQYS